MFRMQKIFWKQPIVCHRLEECYFLQNVYLGVEVADDAVAAAAAVNINIQTQITQIYILKEVAFFQSVTHNGLLPENCLHAKCVTAFVS